MPEYLLARLPDVLLVLAVGVSALTVFLMLLFLVSEGARTGRRIPWQAHLYASVALWLLWVLVR